MAFLNKVASCLKGFVILILFISMVSCGKEQEETKVETDEITKEVTEDKSETKIDKTILPQDLKWLTNDSDPVFSAPEAQKGGIFHDAVLSFPLTFRVVGPDSNSSFRSAILGNHLGLTGIHPNTLNTVPELATHWAYGEDKKTMYFKLNSQARWSDGVPVTADDFAFTLEFMRSRHIVAPWYNDYYTKEIEKVVVFDDQTLAVVSTKAQPDLHLKLGISPTPRHFYKTLDKDFVKKYNWKIVTNTGAYQISDIKKESMLHSSGKKTGGPKTCGFLKIVLMWTRSNFPWSGIITCCGSILKRAGWMSFP